MTDEVKKKATVYIDESGDLGVGKGTTWFVITGAVVGKDEELHCLHTLRKVQNELNCKKIHIREIRDFNKRAYVVRSICDEQFVFASIIINTSKLKIENPSLTYNYACRLLLERCSWYLRDNDMVANIILSSRGTNRDGQLISYIKNQLIDSPDPSVKITNIVFTNVTAISAGQRTMLSLPDICATSLFLAYEKDRFGFTYPCFMRRISSRIYKYKGQEINYGIKYFSADMSPDIPSITKCNPCHQEGQ